MPEPGRVITSLYFGCFYSTGHGFHLPSGDSATYKSRPPTPWGYGVESLPPDTDRRQGAAALHHMEGWTALAVHDYTVDDRPGSKSVFCFDGDLDFAEALDEAMLHFPKILSRVGKVYEATK